MWQLEPDLIAGLLGLFMSVCGGGFLLSLALGIVLCRSAYQSMRRDLDDK
jgi:hypothetical protein